jgi:hypothetical protein
MKTSNQVSLIFKWDIIISPYSLDTHDTWGTTRSKVDDV